MKVISASARLPSPPGLLPLLLLLGPIMLSCSLAAEIRPIFHQLRRLTVHGCCTLSHTRPLLPTAGPCNNMAAGHGLHPTISSSVDWSHSFPSLHLLPIFCNIHSQCRLSEGRRWRGGGGHLPSAVTMELGWTRGWRLIER